MASFDAIVLGTGGIGSAALSALARRGSRVLGLEQFTAAHDRGSSHGQTRLIRQAYFEHPDYVPLVLHSYRLWAELSERRGVPLFRETGLLQVGPADGPVVRGVVDSASQHRLEIEQLGAAEVTRRWPGFVVPAPQVGVYEPRAGILAVEKCVQAHLEDAVAHGATLHTEEAVVGIQSTGTDIQVQTTRGRYETARLVVTAGPWAARWLADVSVRLIVRRKPLFWFATHASVYRATAGCPAFLYETPQGVFYGFPEIDPGELKIAEDSGGDEVVDPANVDRELHPSDQERLTAFISTYLPQVSTTQTGHVVCMYTMSPDEHFLVDTLPGDERICFAAGLSGHGFKFAPALGEALADLATTGESNLPIGFLSCRRASLA